MTHPIVNKWRQRFRRLGLAGLKDAARSGKPATVTASQKAMVIQKACEKPDGGYTNWSQRRIGQQVGISQTKVHQILKKADLKPHKTEYCCGKSPDPEFEQKMFNIVGLYMNPPENVIVDNLAIHKYKKVKEWLVELQPFIGGIYKAKEFYLIWGIFHSPNPLEPTYNCGAFGTIIIGRASL
ncbi:helix-turn-helix domain-containing protein [Dyadobacter luteus]|uniref:helix-turn-helix domain-containing protein n=1 Tax=Dyadobacter luteus TaxID=2259619 RepID=UPI0013144B03|nr:helix-turn-helix domain-containing protein [Dyadobacter luteus]